MEVSYRRHTGTTHTMLHGISNRAPPPTLNTYRTFNNKITTTTNILGIASSDPLQTRNTQHTRQTDPLTEQHITYKEYSITLTTIQVQEAIKQK